MVCFADPRPDAWIGASPRPDVRLVLRPLWGGSLAAILVSSSWRAVRAAIVLDRCCLCDCVASCEAHERWRYELTGESGACRLEGLWALCRGCHEALHPGRALARGGEPGLRRAIGRLAQLRRDGLAEAERHVEAAFAVHAELSDVSRWEARIECAEISRMTLTTRKGSTAAGKVALFAAGTFAGAAR